MGTKIKKNEEYSKYMLGEGAATVVDEDSNYVFELPEWADEKKIKTGQLFFLFNMGAMARALICGFFAVGSIESIARVLIFTKQSSTPVLAYRRFRENGLHAQLWHQHPIKPGTPAWKSLNVVRRMHVVVNRRSTKAGVGIISQKDMAITQFLFMGFSLLMPEEFGVVGSREQFEASNHLWRVIGYMLGMDDRVNCCGETLEETRSRLQAIKEDMFRPALMNVLPDIEDFLKVAFLGMYHADPTLHYESMMFAIKRAVGVPGYHYFEYESSEYKEENRKIFASFSLYTRFRIFLDVFTSEYICHFFVTRWIFNISKFVFGIFTNVFPLFAVFKFGKKYGIVEIMKPKTS